MIPLTRSDTRFGVSAIKGTTPDIDEGKLNNSPQPLLADNESSNKLRKRVTKSQDESSFGVSHQPRGRNHEEATLEAGSSRHPQLVSPKSRKPLHINTKNASPWQSLTKNFSLMLNDSVVIASQMDGRLVMVKEFSGPSADRKIEMLYRIRGESAPNILALLDCFRHDGISYAVFEHDISDREKLPATLAHYALIAPYPTEQQLATIIGQILVGLKYLASKELEHGSITCRNILIGTNGSIRIASNENCRKIVSNRDSLRDRKGVGYVTMELLDKETTNDGPMKPRDIRRWPGNAVQFLSVIESANSFDELIKQPLLSCCEWREFERGIILKPNVYLSEFSVFRGYSHIPQAGR